MDFNLDNVSETSSGNVRFSGVSSGINSQEIIDSIISAKRIQVTRIEDKIDVNNEKVNAFDQLQQLSAGFASSLDILRGNRSFLSDNVFERKLAFVDAVASDTAPIGHTPSAAGNILSISANDNAIAGSHTIEVVQLAKAQQIRSEAFSSLDGDLATAGFTTGDFEINGETISIVGSDSLLDLRDKINAANKGDNATGVTASVVSVSETEHYMVLTSDDSGVANTITFGGDQAVHNSFGFTDTGTDNIKTEIQAAQDAIIRVDNLGVDVVRSSNTITDVFSGVTIDLYKAEPNTTINVDIENDLNAVKTAMIDFVDAYNELKGFIEDQQSEVVREEGGDAEFGVLAFDSTLRKIEQQMGAIVSSGVPGLDAEFSTLAQIGINIESDFTLQIEDEDMDNALLNNLDEVRKLFGFDFTSSDSRLSVINPGSQAIPNYDSDGNPLPYYINIAGTDTDGKPTDANLQTEAGVGTGGLGNGSINISGSLMTASGNTDADGMVFFFNGAPSLGPVDDIEVTFTRGVADQLFNFFEEISQVGGEIDDIKTNLLTQNENYDEDIGKIESRLEIQRASLEARFIAMETAMLQINNLKESLSQQISAMSGDN